MSALNQVSNNQSCFGICNSASGSADDSAAIISSGRLPHGIRQLSEHDDGLETVEAQQQKKEMDALLCQTMENLSLEERKRQQEIVHGVDQVVEDVTSVDRALQALDLHLKLMKHNSMYQVAERINPEYVNARAFQVMFLRKNEYDAKASADQMLRFFESKYQLFGIEKLAEDITLADLSEDDVACLKTGCMQLAGKDKSGRQVFVYFSGYSQNLESWLRVHYFVKMRALEDEATQLRGTVTIWCALGSFTPKTNRKQMSEIVSAMAALPQQQQAIHFCMGETWQYVLCNTLTKLFKDKVRMRFVVHCGSQVECQYQLSTFGIHPQSLRLDPNGRIDTQDHLNWVQSCAVEDKVDHLPIQPSTFLKETNSPSPNDVLFNGGTVIKDLGNQHFQSLIQNYAQAYDEGESETKRQIASTVILKIHGSGGRFLQRVQNITGAGITWKEIPHEHLRKKTMQAFRNRRKMAGASKRKADDCANEPLIAGEPLPNDVIFGRGQRNQGSQLLHRLIKEHSEEYEALARGLKMGLVDTIMQTIKEHDGRFLVKSAGEPDKWVELSHNNARDRISKCFRNYRRAPKGAK